MTASTKSALVLLLLSCCAMGAWWLGAGTDCRPAAAAAQQEALPSDPVAAAATGAARAVVSGRICGRTLRPDGSPVADAVVHVAGLATTRSDRDGRYELTGLSGGAHVVTAEAAGCIAIPSGAVRVRADAATEGVDLVLDRACQVRGQVTQRGGGPLAAAHVSARLRDAAALPDWPCGDFGEDALAVDTDAEGRFCLGPFAPGRVELRVEHPDCLPFARALPSDAAAVQIELTAASRVFGTVLAPDGQQPAALARVLLLATDPVRNHWNVVAECVPSDQDAAAGRFRLPVPLPREVRLVAVTRDFGTATSATFRVPAGTAHGPLTLRAEAGVACVGRIHDAAGAPIEGVSVRLRGDGAGHEVGQVRTGADGTFALRLAAGRYAARIARAGFAPQQQAVEVAADRATATLEWVLQRGAAVTGHILGVPAVASPALEVLAVPAGDVPGSPAIAMVRDGAFAFDFLPAGDYRLVLRERGQAAVPAHGEVVRLAAGATTTLGLDATAFGLAAVRGTVTRNGAVMPFATVQLLRNGDRPLASATADRCGQFEFAGLAAGPLLLLVRHGKAGPQIASLRLDLQAGEDRQETVAVACGAIAGRLVATGSSQPLGDVRVDVLGQDGGVLATARSGADGGFRLPMVPAGSWCLCLERAARSPARRQAVVVGADRTTQLADIGL